ncbi:MAG: 4-hydroxy-tetrahydrodipicolinate reductase [Dehalococcoidales bacterium]|nr:4-hydroxy-tetrahydrodipicolinate reductase [Dehalococcoidales bacterium]
MKPIKVVICGALGRMGKEVVNTLYREPRMQLVGAVELPGVGDSLPLPDGSGTVPLSADLNDILTTSQPDVLVDFTVAQSAVAAARQALPKGVNLVIGTTGLTAAELKELDQLAIAHQVGVVVAPNFALGAVLMIYLAKLAARYFEYAEIIELHHDRKIDSPSGTALSTARAMAEERGKPFRLPSASPSSSRGELVEGIPIHSVRLPGLLAHQEVILGAAGQTLTIRHDTVSRECFMPGVMLAIKKVIGCRGLIYGLDTLLGLGEQ